MTADERYLAIQEGHWNRHEQTEHVQIPHGASFKGLPRLCYQAGYDAGYQQALADRSRESMTYPQVLAKLLEWDDVERFYEPLIGPTQDATAFDFPNGWRLLILPDGTWQAYEVACTSTK